MVWVKSTVVSSYPHTVVVKRSVIIDQMTCSNISRRFEGLASVFGGKEKIGTSTMKKRIQLVESK